MPMLAQEKVENSNQKSGKNSETLWKKHQNDANHHKTANIQVT